jgi:ATP-binding cassette subfamily B protein
MGFIYSYLKPYRNLLLLALFCATVNQVFSLLDPQIFRIIIDRYISNFSDFSRNEFISGVGLLLLASIGVAMVSRVAKNIEDYLSNMLTQKIGMRLYQKNFVSPLHTSV